MGAAGRDRDWRRTADLVVIGLLLAVYAWRFIVPILLDPHAPRADDFQDYLYASRQILGGGDPYGDFIRNHLPWDWSLSSGYLYPPAFALLLIPLTWVSNDLAVRIWLLLIQAVVLAALWLVYRVIGRPGRRELLCMVLLTTTFFPLASSVFTGAMNTVLLLMLTGAWAFWMHRRDVAGGVLVGAAAVFKLFPLALLPYLVYRRHWRLVTACLLTGLAGITIGLAVTGVSHNLFYFGQLLPHLSAGTGYRENQSLSGLAARLCDPRTADHAGAAGWCGRAIGWPAILVVLGLVLVATRRASRSGLEFALAVTALPLVSSVAWSFHLVILLFPIALLVRHLFEHRPSAGRLRLLGLAWICFTVAPVFHYLLIVHPMAGPWGTLLSGLFEETYLLGTLILFGILWLSVREAPRTAMQPARLAA